MVRLAISMKGIFQNSFNSTLRVMTNNAKYFLGNLNIANYRGRSEEEIAEILAQQSSGQELIDVPEPEVLSFLGLAFLVMGCRKFLASKNTVYLLLLKPVLTIIVSSKHA